MYKKYLKDCKLAQSIGTAVNQDNKALVAALTAEAYHACEDREMALLLDEGDENIRYLMHADENDSSLSKGWLPLLTEIMVSNSRVTTPGDEEAQAGPSMTSTERQADLLARLAPGSTCSVCHEGFRCAATVKVRYEHRYCIKCAKDLFVQATHDETLWPPRCCKTPIDVDLVRRHMTGEELKAYDLACVEFATINRTYCSNRQCGSFLPPALISTRTKIATCNICGTCT